MSDHPRFPRHEAMRIYHEVRKNIQSFIVRDSPVGSLRRGVPEVGDIDMHVKVFPGSVPPIRARLAHLGTWNRGGERLMVVDNVLDSPLTLELGLIYAPRNWWSMLAIKTGPRHFQQWIRQRLEILGVPRPHGEIPVNSESEFFHDILRIPFTAAVHRTPEWVETLPRPEEF